MIQSPSRQIVLAVGFKLIKKTAYENNSLGGQMPCPVCLDEVYYRIDPKSHRMTARCGNDDCIRMKE